MRTVLCLKKMNVINLYADLAPIGLVVFWIALAVYTVRDWRIL